MRKERLNVIQNVTAEFLPAEQAAGAAVIRGAKCIATMLEERQIARLPIDTGADEIALMAEANYYATLAHVRFIKLHARLKGLPATIGITGFGPERECEPNEFYTGADLPSRLQVVAAAA